MDGVEHELCGNCKKEIPQHNYVMHTAHCARNITLCPHCKEPIARNLFESHKKSCQSDYKTKTKKPEPLPLPIEKNSYYHERKEVEERKIAARREEKIKKYEKLVDSGYSLKSAQSSVVNVNGTRPKDPPKEIYTPPASSTPSNKLLACKFCDLELPKLDLEEHENYCGSRTDKCLQCGELVMFKYKQSHMDSNHGFTKRKDEPGPRATWDSSSTATRRDEPTSSPRPRFRPTAALDAFGGFDPTAYLPSMYAAPSVNSPNKEKGESYKEISRRLDCKTEYIRNLLHDSASITVPLRHNGAVPRNHFNHNKGPAPQPPRRRRNPPTELVIPCEFCDTPIPHEDLVQHETGCRPDLARFNPRRRSPQEEDDYFTAPQQPSSPEVELPCEFCSDMIPASQLWRHQSTCN